ncbi:A24 family peptidase [Rossellomorea sp. AcN35-11]|nr:A24 family peptidase [Rossellomorea sp. AcN35-11]
MVGAGTLLLPFLLGGMGAGDVKLMGAIGALMGSAFTLKAFVVISVIGGGYFHLSDREEKGSHGFSKGFIYLSDPVGRVKGNLSYES